MLVVQLFNINVGGTIVSQASKYGVKRVFQNEAMSLMKKPGPDMTLFVDLFPGHLK